MRNMYITRQNDSAEQIQLFHQLTQKFYDVDDSSGLFLDLGANIGSSGIYFVKKFAPNLKLLAFEPDAENFKMLRANLILNDMYENAVVENCGLGAEKSEQTFYKYSEDAGAHSFFNYRSDNYDSVTIKVVSLDDYFAEKNINAKDVKYIWIDTEGFEAQVLFGMKNILAENPAPIFTEFSPTFWQKSGYYEKMMEVLTEHYTAFIFAGETMRKSEIEMHPIEKLWDYQNSTVNVMGTGGGLFGENIFLVHQS